MSKPIVAIIGRANVGKSSLFNRMVERKQAIVADEPGTTRDSVYGRVERGQYHFWAVDTAGLKTPEDDFELTIQDQIKQAVDDADVLLVVVEHGVQPTQDEKSVAKIALKSKKPVLLVINKADRKSKLEPAYQKLGIRQMYFVSAEHSIGVEELLDAIAEHIARHPADPESDLALSFIGRPNVGKSSLFNSMAKKQQAIVADFAGTTRDVNRIELTWHKQKVSLLDTAGIRRSGKIGKGIEHFSVMRALWAIEQSDICCLVIDASEPATKLDQKIAGMIKDANKGLIVVVSKWDAIDKDSWTHDQMAAKISRDFPFIAWAPLIFTSAITGQNVNRIMQLAFQIMERRQTIISTRELNNWLQAVTTQHPPSGLKNTHPKLRYITQIDANPPRFRVFGSDTKFLHWSYKRHMDREIRKLADFVGTPLVFEFSDKKETADGSTGKS